MNLFFSRVSERQASIDSLLCVGLDPELARLPRRYLEFDRPVLRFCLDIIDATSELTCCYKPQFAHFAAADALEDLKEVIAYLRSRALPVILDAKRGDVGSTSYFYAAEAFDIYGADAITVNPYLGGDSLRPFLERADRGVILLCRTSNPGGEDLQNQMLSSGKEMYERVAELATKAWNQNNNIGLVVGATRPQELKRVRAIVGDMFILMPGIGAQGGDIAESLDSNKGGGLIVSSSRAILYPDEASLDSVRRVAERTRDAINLNRS